MASTSPPTRPGRSTAPQQALPSQVVVEPAGLVGGVDKIAVLRATSLGDYLFSVPALAALRAAYPAAELVLLGAQWHARELRDRPGPVDRFLVVPPLPGVRPAEPAEQPEPDEPTVHGFLAAAQHERFDLAVQLHGGGRHTNPLVRALGARLTAGLRAADAEPLDRWVRYVHHQPEVFRCLEVVGLVGAEPVGLAPDFPLTGADVDEARAAAGDFVRPPVAIHPGAADPRRRWPARRFAAVGDALARAGCDILLTGTHEERDLVHRVRAQMRQPARDLAGALSLGGLAALYAAGALVVANDTGPLHLATAVGAPTVGLYWVVNAVNYAPVSRARHRPLTSWTTQCPRCAADATRELYPARPGTACPHRDSFLSEIPVAEVVDAALDLLGAQRP